MREVRATVMVMTPQVLELFWTFLTREVERRGQTARFERARRLARRLPYRLRRLVFRSVHAQFGGALHLLVSAGAYLPPELQQAWEDLGIVVIQGYGSTECGIVTANDQWHHPAGRRGTRARALDRQAAPGDVGDPRARPERLGRLLAQRRGHRGVP